VGGLKSHFEKALIKGYLPISTIAEFGYDIYNVTAQAKNLIEH
jgi:hypothetical protein